MKFQPWVTKNRRLSLQQIITTARRVIRKSGAQQGALITVWWVGKTSQAGHIHSQSGLVRDLKKIPKNILKRDFVYFY